MYYSTLALSTLALLNSAFEFDSAAYYLKKTVCLIMQKVWAMEYKRSRRLPSKSGLTKLCSRIDKQQHKTVPDEKNDLYPLYHFEMQIGNNHPIPFHVLNTKIKRFTER